MAVIETYPNKTNESMECPYCNKALFVDWLKIKFFNKKSFVDHIEDSEYTWGLRSCICPACNKLIIQLGKEVPKSYHGKSRAAKVGAPIDIDWEWKLLKPRKQSRPLPPEVPKEFAKDYNEACLVLDDSPKASAALSRRCLQHLIREKAKIKKNILSAEIQELIDSGQLPSSLSKDVDAIRGIGKFAAHPIKSKSTNTIVDVEQGEAEWTLSVLEELLEHFFVCPEISKKRRQKLNKKLKDAGKSPMK